MDYLARDAAYLDVDIRTHQRVESVEADGPGFVVRVHGGTVWTARAVVAATGGFCRPHRPDLPGLSHLTGTVLHTADYRHPGPFAGQRVVLVGGANSAVQIAAELAEQATVTLVVRRPIRFVPQRLAGRDLHFWFGWTGIGRAPIGRLVRKPPTVRVFDVGRYRAAIGAGRPDVRPMFTSVDTSGVTWSDGRRERVDILILATGYRPDLGYFARLGVLDAAGHPRHVDGVSSTHPGVGFVGLEGQRNLASATLRGVGGDADRVASRQAPHTRLLAGFRPHCKQLVPTSTTSTSMRTTTPHHEEA